MANVDDAGETEMSKQDLEDWIHTAADENCGLQPVQPVEESMKQIGAALFNARVRVVAVLSERDEAREVLRDACAKDADLLNAASARAEDLVAALKNEMARCERFAERTVKMDHELVETRTRERDTLRVLANVVNCVVAHSSEWAMREARELVGQRAPNLLNPPTPTPAAGR